MKSGNLNFLEPSGPLQACNGTALPFFTCYIIWHVTVIALSPCFIFKWDGLCLSVTNYVPHKSNAMLNIMWLKTANSLLLCTCFRLAVENLILVSLTGSVARFGVLYFHYLWFEMKECFLCCPFICISTAAFVSEIMVQWKMKYCFHSTMHRTSFCFVSWRWKEEWVPVL